MRYMLNGPQCPGATPSCEMNNLNNFFSEDNSVFRKQLAIGAWAAGLAAIILRLPFRTHVPVSWDSVQYVLGVLDYNVVLHEPHPPGYYFYIHTAKVLVGVGVEPYTALVLLSLLAGALTVGVLTWWTGRLLGKYGAWAAAILTLFSPLAWMYSTHGDTYAVSGLFAALVGFLCWRLVTTEAEPIWLSALALGLAGGFRATDAIFLLPLWLWCVRGKRTSELALGVALFGLVTAAWVFPMVASCGGWGKYQVVSGELSRWVWSQAPVRSPSTFPTFAITIVMAAVALLRVGWPFVIFARRKYLPGGLRASHCGTFLILWCVPALAFYPTVHFGQPGYMMLLLPAAVLLASVGLVGFTKMTNSKHLLVALGLIVVLNSAFTWGVTVSDDSERETNMRHIAHALSQFNPKNTVALTGSPSPLRPHAGQPFLDFRHGMYLAPQIPVYIFPLELPDITEHAPNHAYQLVSERVRPPIKLRHIRNLLLLDPDLHQFLPKCTASVKLLDNSEAQISLVSLDPEAPLILGSQGELDFIPLRGHAVEAAAGLGGGSSRSRP